LLAYHGNEFLRSRHGETQAGQEQRRTKEELKGAASKGRGGGCVAIAMKAMADTAATWPERGKATKVTTMG